MTTEVEEAQDLYTNQLKPQAIKEARDYVMSRTPSRLWDEMSAIIDADIADGGGTELPPNEYLLKNGDSVAVISNGGFPAPGSPGAASVINGILQGVQLQPVG